MKRYILTMLAALVVALGVNAQKVTFSPATFVADDEVTLTVDVNGTPMAGQTEAYIWIWSNPGGKGPAKDGSTNTSWTNAPASAKMTAAGTNKWSFKFTGTTLFSLTPGELNDFGFLVKTKDGSKKTDDFKPFSFDPLIFTPAMLRVFPSKVGRDDVVTVNFERSLAGTVNEQRMTPVTATVTVYDDAGDQVGQPLSLQVRKTGANIWSTTFIPTVSFNAPAGKKLKKLTYHFNGTVLDATGAVQTVSTSDASVEFMELK
jgi:hypothetical protein